jgi:heat shock protein HtpX
MFKNTLKTTVLLAGLGGLIVTVFGVLGGGSSTALLFGLAVALVMVGGSYWCSDKLALKAAKAQVIAESDNPQFYGMVRELARRADLPMPKVAISPNAQPNAFATGRNPRHAVVCATDGLLRTLPRDELAGVMAHELMHVRHRDILIGSVAAAIATAISFAANMAMWGAMFGGRGNNRGGNPFALIAVAVLAPIAASLMQMAVSRSREFEADRGAAELLGTGQSLASALRRIEATAATKPMVVQPQQAYAYIHNPLAEFGGRRRDSRDQGGPNMAKLFSTHPSTDDRIAALQAYDRQRLVSA